MAEDIIIRRANENDCCDIAHICSTSLGYKSSDKLVRERLIRLDDRRESVFVAEHGGRVVGFVHCERYEVLYCEPLMNVLGIAIDNDHKRKGIGRMLMQAVEQDAADRGITAIRLNSGGSRADAHSFYRSLGFDSEKEQIRFLKQL